MWSDGRRDPAAEQAATTLSLHDLIAVRPPYLRGRLAPGQRLPGGERSGRGRAQSLEFDGITPYVPGDDVRSIDWRSTVRTGRTQVRRYFAEAHRGRMIVVDLHAGLHFGTHERLMAKSVALVAAYLAWEALILFEPVGMAIPAFGVEPPRRGRRHLLRLLDRLHGAYRDMPPAGGLSGAVADGSAVMRHGDEICVVSDFADPLAEIVEIGKSQSKMRALRAFVVEDPMMRLPLRAGSYPLRDAKTGQRQVIRVDSRAAAESGAVAERMRAERAGRLRDGGWHVLGALDLLPRRGRAGG